MSKPHPKILIEKALKDATHNYKDKLCHADLRMTSWMGGGEKRWSKCYFLTYEDGTTERVGKKKFEQEAHTLHIPMPESKNALSRLKACGRDQTSK